jgi:general secretion pathway protein J
MSQREAGFSLIEVLVAVMVFATVSAISVGLLAGALRSKDQGEAALERLAAVQRVSALLREDIGQMTVRAARTQEGLTDPRIFAADIEGTQAVRRLREGREILVLTRTGWANPGGVQPRSTLQRVAWVLQDGALYREVRAYPDAAPGLEPRRQLMIDGISEVGLDVLTAGGWAARASLAAEADAAVILPDAVRLRYALAGLGVMEHVVLSPAAEAR